MTSSIKQTRNMNRCETLRVLKRIISLPRFLRVVSPTRALRPTGPWSRLRGIYPSVRVKQSSGAASPRDAVPGIQAPEAPFKNWQTHRAAGAGEDGGRSRPLPAGRPGPATRPGPHRHCIVHRAQHGEIDSRFMAVFFPQDREVGRREWSKMAVPKSSSSPLESRRSRPETPPRGSPGPARGAAPYLFSLWSRTGRWRARVSFCDSSGHVS